MRHLRLRVHDRAARAVLHRLARENGANMAGQAGDLIAIGLDGRDPRYVEFRRKVDPCIVAEPRFEREIAFGRKILSKPLSFITSASAAGMSEIGDNRALLRENRLVCGENAADAEVAHEPFFLGFRRFSVAGNSARHGRPRASVSLSSARRRKRLRVFANSDFSS